MITKFIQYIKENNDYDEKLVRIMAWLEMLYIYEDNDGMDEKNWIKDNRMGVTFGEAVKYLNENGYAEFVNGKWKMTKNGYNELFSFFKVPKTRDEWLNYDNQPLKKYDTENYPISRIPEELFSRRFERETKKDIHYTLQNTDYYDIRNWWSKYQRGTVGWWVKMNKFLGLKGDLMPVVDSLILYRGLNLKCYAPDYEDYFNKDICVKIKNGEIKIGDTIKCNKPSWSLDPSVARSFASGKKGLDDMRTMKENEIGIVLKHKFDSSEILLDTNWVENHKFLNSELVFPGELEVIVQPKNRTVEIVDIFNSDEYYKKVYSKS